jgi:DDE superfamily endonuclease
MLVLDRHESYESAAFQDYCKTNNIITLCLPLYLSYLTQLLDVGCFSVLKQMYGRQIKTFIKAYINHITKVKFFLAFHTVYKQSITPENAIAGFCRAGLVPFNPDTVLLKLDVKLRTPTPTRTPPTDTNPWVSQTPHNPRDALSQATLVKTCIIQHQGSLLTPTFIATASLAKGIKVLAHKVTLMSAEIRTLRSANKALSKRRRAKKTCIR